MKNIHVLPTDKPSNLVFEKISNRFYTNSRRKENSKNIQNQNIYITNSEEIKEGDYCIIVDAESVLYGQFEKHKGKYLKNDQWKKIILTTDSDLIKFTAENDGVQPIDDEFLEWFVKNPSCEEIQVEKSFHWDNGVYEYEIIIPKEEPKQIKCYCGHTITCDCGPEQEILLEDIFNEEKRQGVKELIDKHKQETLEEAAINRSNKIVDLGDNFQSGVCQGFINGAKWQMERSYSEEDMIKAICMKKDGVSVDSIIEKFKNK